MGEKLRLVTRSDLTPAQQAVQAAHALRQFGADHPQSDAKWFASSNTLALLAAEDELALSRVADHAAWLGAPVARFYEPDLAGALTAIAIGPSADASKATKSLPPALEKI